MRKAKSASDGNNLKANWERVSISLFCYAIQELTNGCEATKAGIRH